MWAWPAAPPPPPPTPTHSQTHTQVLREAVEADEPVAPYESLDESARLVLEELQERQALVSEGHLDLETSFDDFRIVLGDNTM